MAEELTPRENTWLVLKYGTDYTVKLYQRLRHGEQFTGAEYRAAMLGKQISEGVIDEMCAQIKEEVDQEMINKISRSMSK